MISSKTLIEYHFFVMAAESKRGQQLVNFIFKNKKEIADNKLLIAHHNRNLGRGEGGCRRIILQLKERNRHLQNVIAQWHRELGVRANKRYKKAYKSSY